MESRWALASCFWLVRARSLSNERSFLRERAQGTICGAGSSSPFLSNISCSTKKTFYPALRSSRPPHMFHTSSMDAMVFANLCVGGHWGTGR
ncbi:hypothetical protein HD554DRAFT_2093708 [Boletus coccyginus]|nr:hypothetical protein HD554DRAFT_2093708 [Boletus coccyginus]